MRMRIGKNRDRILAAAAAGWISFAACCTAQAQAPGRRDSSGPVSLQEEKVQITIPGMEDTCTLLWISDMHIVTISGCVTESVACQGALGYNALCFEK